MEMTHAHRLILSNQYQLLSHVDPDNAEHYARLKVIVERGYGLQIQEITKGFGRFSEEQCRDVLETMEMHHAMQESYKLLSSSEHHADLDPRRLQFLGYDFISEAQYVDYVRFLVNFEGLYPQFDAKEHQFNSQVPMKDKYQRMKTIWQHCPRQYHLCSNELQQIINA